MKYNHNKTCVQRSFKSIWCRYKVSSSKIQ